MVALEQETATAPHWGLEVYQGLVAPTAGLVRRRLFVAVGAGLVGFAVGRVLGEEGELESVAVSQGERRRGLGAALCRAVLGWAGAEGARWVDLEVRAGSEGARGLYGGLGFVEVGLRRGYYEGPADDAVMMRFTLKG